MFAAQGRLPDNLFVCFRATVVNIIAPDEPVLARRILALLWAYERGEFLDRVLHEPLCRRRPRESAEPAVPVPPADSLL